MTVDLNADVGEGAGEDDAVMAVVTSVNVACGVHAGSRALMAATLAVARNRGLAVGAHPGYADRAGSGRRELDLTSAEITALVADQIRSLDELAAAAGVSLAHVKPHGALYSQAARDELLARAVARGVARFGRDLILMGLAGSLAMRRAAGALRAAGLRRGQHVAVVNRDGRHWVQAVLGMLSGLRGDARRYEGTSKRLLSDLTDYLTADGKRAPEWLPRVFAMAVGLCRVTT